jgi:hypothetical protein
MADDITLHFLARQLERVLSEQRSMRGEIRAIGDQLSVLRKPRQRVCTGGARLPSIRRLSWN